MNPMRGTVLSRKPLYALTLLFCAGGTCSAAMAGTVTGPGRVAQVLPGSPAENWLVSNGATLEVLGGSTLVINATSGGFVHLVGGTVNASTNPALPALGAIRLTGGGGAGATALIERSQVTDNTGRALVMLLGAEDDVQRASITANASNITGRTEGAFIASGGLLRLDQGTRLTGQGGAGVYLTTGRVEVAGGSLVEGQSNGIVVNDTTRIAAEQRGRTVLVDGSTVSGRTGAGILVTWAPGFEPETTASITLANGASVTGGNGIAVQTDANTQTDLSIDASDIVGDLVSNGGRLDVDMRNSATLTGRTQGVGAMAIGGGSTWNVVGDSDVGSLALDAGAIAFQPSADGAHHTVRVAGPFSGSGGTVTLNTEMNAGGPLTNQFTDRLLIQGDVTTTGTTELVVVPTGAGAGTDLNGDGVVDAHEGISLVQVGGDSRADAFTLRGGYVAAGPYQYTLHAFGPGQTDPAQNLLPSGDLNWDYRLGNRIVCENECEPENPEDGGGDGGENPNPDKPLPEDGRNAVVPQVPSYLSAPAALLTYGDMMTDGLHQRLGDIRQGTSHDPVGGEVFARYLGGQLRYSSNRSFGDYGYDFDQQVNALQLGGSLIALDHDNGTLRAGWAADHGTTRVTPKAADGNSRAKYRANGVSAWATWQSGNGFWVDGVVGAIRYRGDVGTDLRGSEVGRIRANGWTTSVEAGMPFALGSEWTIEPRFQLKHQSLNFRDFRDGDGLDVRLGTAKQTSATIGGRLSRTANPVFMPYASIDLTHTSNGDPSVDVSSEEWNAADRFRSGRVGNGFRVSAGAVSQLGSRVQIYGEANYRHAIGSYGMRGFAGNLGVRVTF